MARIVMHVGAHKTATTYLQNRLDGNRAILEKHDVHYPAIVPTRRNLTYRAQQEPGKLNAFTEDLVNRVAGSGTVLLSDENFIGGVDDITKIGGQYKRAGRMLARYCALIGAERPEFFFAIRDHASFVVSLYCEYLRHFPFVAFDEFHRVFVDTNFSWKDVIDDILAHVPGATMTVWDFRDLARVERTVTSRMIGFDDAELQPVADNARDSFSGVAIRCFEALSTVLDHEHMAIVLPEIARSFPKSKAYPKFDPLSIAETNRLTAIYEEDKAQILAIRDRIHFVQPPD